MSRALGAGLLAWLAVAALATPVLAAACPNEQLRAEDESIQLPECRAYEQVSPPGAGEYDVTFEGIAPGSSTVFFDSSGAIAGTEAGEDKPSGSPRIFSSARGAYYWAITSLTGFEGLGQPENYEFVGSSPDGLRIFFVTSALDEALESYGLHAGVLYESVAGGPPIVLSHNQNAEPEPIGRSAEAQYGTAVASADGTHVVFETKVPLNSTAAATPPSQFYVYESDAAGNVSLVSVSSGGTLPAAGHGATIGAVQGRLTTNAVSSDGATVFFSSIDQYEPSAPDTQLQVFMRRGGTTTDVSKSQTGTPGTSGAEFNDASSSGDQVVFSDRDQLTADAPSTGTHQQIYRYDAETQSLSLVSKGDEGLSDGEHGATFLTMSADGSHVFFASEDQLDPAGPAFDPANPRPFLYEEANGHVTYIATLSPTDLLRMTQAGPHGNSGTSPLGPVRATPDGTHLVFQSEEPLTLDDHNAEPGRTNVYEWSEGKGLVRVSQGSLPGSGDGPYGATIGSQRQPVSFGFSTLDTADTYGASQADGRAVSEDGDKVFFSSREALTANATNGPLHVYEWNNGQTYLISPAGPQATDAQYLENSPDGADVYFATGQDILPSDTDGERVKIYDARVDGGFPAARPAPACTDNECPGSAPPARSTPLSSLFFGPGNATPSASAPRTPSTVSTPKPLSKALEACKKDKPKSKRKTCEKTARRRYGTAATKSRHRKGRK